MIFDCLTFQYGEYEQVVVEDRIEKEKARRKAEQELEELKAAVKVSGREKTIRMSHSNVYP